MNSENYQKLLQRYQDMSDQKLLEMAESLEDLIGDAQKALTDELINRGITTATQGKDSPAVIANKKGLVGIYTASDPEEAQRIGDILENAGIRTILSTERIEYVDGTAEDKPVVHVVYLDRQRALAVLSEALPPENEDVVSQYAICPSCHSADIVLENLDSQPGNASDAKYHWACDSCGNKWTDDGLEQLGELKGE